MMPEKKNIAALPGACSICVSLICMVLFCLQPAAWGAELPNPREMKFPALEFSIPKAEKHLLANGIPVYMLKDSEIPIVSISALIRTGSVYDPPGKSGLSSLVGSQLRGGGTVELDPRKLDEELEFMASSIESSFGTDSGTVSMTTLSRNTARTLELFASVLFRPRFDPKRLEIARQQSLETIRRENDDPKELGDRILLKSIYSGHPLGVTPTSGSVASITRQDMVDFHKRFVRGENLIITVAGDFNRDEIIGMLEKHLGGQRGEGPLAIPDIPLVRMQFAPEVLYVRKKVNQSVIRLGHLGITKDNPDIYAIRVLDFILGGSFTSRLMMEIRTNQGLAYNVGSHFDIGRRFTGSFTAETETRSETTAKTISLMTSIIERIRKEPVTAEELKLAKDSIVNSFLFGFTSPTAIVSQQARLELYGYDPQYLDRYRGRISAVTSKDILQAAQKYLKPESFKLVVVGDDGALDRPLVEFGEVREISLP